MASTVSIKLLKAVRDAALLEVKKRYKEQEKLFKEQQKRQKSDEHILSNSVQDYFISLSKKYFYTIEFTILECKKATETSVQHEEHLANPATVERAKRIGSYQPYPFEFEGYKVSYPCIVSIFLIYSVIGSKDFTGTITDFYNAQSFRRYSETTFRRHLQYALSIGWLEVEYIVVDDSKSMSRNNIQGRYTMPQIAQKVVNHIAETGYRL